MTKFILSKPLLVFAQQGENNTILFHSGAFDPSSDINKYGELIDFSSTPMRILELKGNITSISYSAEDKIFGISSMDRSFRLYQLSIDKGIIYFYEIKDPISAIMKSTISARADHIALLNEDNILRVYKYNE